MNELFGRVWATTIGPAGAKGRTWDKLRTAFKVEKTKGSTPNKLELTIYNLSADSRAYIAKRHVILLEAGYESTSRLLFTGSIEKVDHKREGVDWLTKIESADGVAGYRSAILSHSLGPGATPLDSLRVIAKQMGLTLGQVKGFPDAAKFQQGRQLYGPARSELDALCRSHGLVWSIQDGVLQVLPSGGSLDAGAVLLNRSTGLVGVPERTEKGVKITSLLQGGINPGRVVVVEAMIHGGTYVADTVTHEGDSHGGDWHTVIEMQVGGKDHGKRKRHKRKSGT